MSQVAWRYPDHHEWFYLQNGYGTFSYLVCYHPSQHGNTDNIVVIVEPQNTREGEYVIIEGGE